jgi:hypothetical protein
MACQCHNTTFCPDLICVGSDDDVPIFARRDSPEGLAAIARRQPTIGAGDGELRLASAVALAAGHFCAELCEDADGVPQPELRRLHAALDVWEATPEDDFALYDDSTPETAVMAALKWVVEDGSETDRTRRTAAAAITVIEQLRAALGNKGE